MTPQERAAQLYGSLTCTTYRDGYQDPDNDIALIADVLQQTRRAALLEAAEKARERSSRQRNDCELRTTHMLRTDEAELIAYAIDRLAQEG